MQVFLKKILPRNYQGYLFLVGFHFLVYTSQISGALCWLKQKRLYPPFLKDQIFFPEKTHLKSDLRAFQLNILECLQKYCRPILCQAGNPKVCLLSRAYFRQVSHPRQYLLQHKLQQSDHFLWVGNR